MSHSGGYSSLHHLEVEQGRIKNVPQGYNTHIFM